MHNGGLARCSHEDMSRRPCRATTRPGSRLELVLRAGAAKAAHHGADLGYELRGRHSLHLNTEADVGVWPFSSTPTSTPWTMNGVFVEWTDRFDWIVRASMRDDKTDQNMLPDLEDPAFRILKVNSFDVILKKGGLVVKSDFDEPRLDDGVLRRRFYEFYKKNQKLIEYQMDGLVLELYNLDLDPTVLEAADAAFKQLKRFHAGQSK